VWKADAIFPDFQKLDSGVHIADIHMARATFNARDKMVRTNKSHLGKRPALNEAHAEGGRLIVLND
jgi:hypothetical protein